MSSPSVSLSSDRGQVSRRDASPSSNGGVPSHSWLSGPGRVRRERLGRYKGEGAIVVSAHRNWGGPYTAGGQVARILTPLLLEHMPALAARHDIELLAMAPDLDTLLTPTHPTLDAMTGFPERTRLFPVERTKWIAHGVADLLSAWSSETAPMVLVVDDASHADPTDAELLAILVGRLDPADVRIVVGSATADLSPALASALEGKATREVLVDDRPSPADVDTLATARRYIESDGTDDDPRLVEAWKSIDHTTRACLHDSRADALEAVEEFAPRLGAIPFHRMNGSDPMGAGLATVHRALEHCVLAGHFDAAIELARIEYGRLDWSVDPHRCWVVGSKLCAALVGLGRVDEAFEVYLEAQLGTTDPMIQMQAAYGQAMLCTRHYDRDRRDHRQAKAWLQVALTIADLLPDGEDRAVAKTFYSNALALVEVHLGQPHEALRLVEEGRERLDRELRPDQWRLHRSVLGHNIARVYSQMRSLEAALTEYTRAIAIDPNYPDYHLERGNVRRRLGDTDGALHDYTTAIDVGLPCPQAHYNRGDLALELGDLAMASGDFDRTLELDDSYVDAWLNRAALRLDAGDLDGAASDIAAGLARDQDSAHLYCLRGTLSAELGDRQSASRDLKRAIEHEPRLAGAWANLGVLHWEGGEIDEALRCFDESLAIEDDDDVRANRALAMTGTRCE